MICSNNLLQHKSNTWTPPHSISTQYNNADKQTNKPSPYKREILFKQKIKNATVRYDTNQINMNNLQNRAKYTYGFNLCELPLRITSTPPLPADAMTAFCVPKSTPTTLMVVCFSMKYFLLWCYLCAKRSDGSMRPTFQRIRGVRFV